MSELVSRECAAALDAVISAFEESRNTVSSLPKYEADSAAFVLMQLVLNHAKGISRLASSPSVGLYLTSAWVLVRSCFESAATAFWLAKDDDWKERESRWLGWIRSEEEYWERIANDFRSIASEPGSSATEPTQDLAESASAAFERAQVLKKRREAITKLLPKDSRYKKPEMRQLLKEAGLTHRFYLRYRVASQLTHGSPISREWLANSDGEKVYLGPEAPLSSWQEPLRMTSWSIAQPGTVVLLRVGAKPNVCDQLAAFHHRLVVMTEQLTKRD